MIYIYSVFVLYSDWTLALATPYDQLAESDWLVLFHCTTIESNKHVIHWGRPTSVSQSDCVSVSARVLDHEFESSSEGGREGRQRVNGGLQGGRQPSVANPRAEKTPLPSPPHTPRKPRSSSEFMLLDIHEYTIGSLLWSGFQTA